MGTYFYPATAECQTVVQPYPDATGFAPKAPNPPNNTMGGYGGFLDVTDYNGTSGAPGSNNIFIGPDAALTAPGIQDLMANYLAAPPAFPDLVSKVWYLMRKVDFKDWSGIAGIFWKKTSFIMEVDIKPTLMPAVGGFRDEAQNLALAGANIGSWAVSTPYPAVVNSPFTSTQPQGSGIKLEAIITDQTTHLEVIKDSHLFTGSNGVASTMGSLSFPRQIVQLNLTDITPAEMATMTLRIRTEQYSATQQFFGADYPHAAQDSTIYRIGLTPDPSALKSSGKQSAALTSR